MPPSPSAPESPSTVSSYALADVALVCTTVVALLRAIGVWPTWFEGIWEGVVSAGLLVAIFFALIYLLSFFPFPNLSVAPERNEPYLGWMVLRLTHLVAILLLLLYGTKWSSISLGGGTSDAAVGELKTRIKDIAKDSEGRAKVAADQYGKRFAEQKNVFQRMADDEKKAEAEKKKSAPMAAPAAPPAAPAAPKPGA